MGLFQFDQNEILTFFGVLVRFSVLFVIFPFLGDKIVPAPVKVLMALVFSVVVFPVLVSNGQVVPKDAAVWGSTTSGIVNVVLSEAFFGVIIGFTSRLVFDAIQIGGDIAGTLMGFAAASHFDPQAETQTGVISKFQSALAMLIFLVINGHHLMLQATLQSYRIVGMGKVDLGNQFINNLIQFSSEVLRVGFQLAAPMAISFFAVNVVYGIMAKALPQLNILVLSFSVSAFIGFFVLLLSSSEFFGATSNLFSQIGERMGTMMFAISSR